MSAASLVDRVWYGGSGGARLARALLAPASVAFRAAAGARGALYDAGLLRAHGLALPALSVGNISVGGTGKTPFAAHVARELRARGASPAVVLRGYGDDEPLVHARLNPDVPVLVTPDRVVGAERAREAGADVVVLDDAFQHRRARRDVDVVLVSADRWRADLRVLPAGPLREPPAALRRASLVVVTRKAASAAVADEVVAWVERVAPGVDVAVAHLAPWTLHAWGGDDVLSLDALAGERVLATAAVGDPAAFVAQLDALGAHVRPRTFRDHHRFTSQEAAALAAEAHDGARVVCTLKDAVKLGPLWPAGGPTLWYVTQAIILERGQMALARSLDRLVQARTR